MVPNHTHMDTKQPRFRLLSLSVVLVMVMLLACGGVKPRDSTSYSVQTHLSEGRVEVETIQDPYQEMRELVSESYSGGWSIQIGETPTYSDLATEEEALGGGGPGDVSQETEHRPPFEEPDLLAPDARQHLVYTAQFTLAVFQVSRSQDEVIEAVENLGGFLFRRDNQSLVIRVPASRFNEAVQVIEGFGDVLDRLIEVQDVSEEFTDLGIRLRNHQLMRERLEALLEEAQTVTDAIAVERELQRLTEKIELMQGRLRFLEDRVAFSTITVRFQPRHTTTRAMRLFRLPFAWVYQLGLPNLLSL